MNAFENLTPVIRQIKNRITLDNCTSLKNELDTLSKNVSDQAPERLLVNMMQSLSNYLSARLEKAHPAALPVLDAIAEAACTLSALPETQGSARKNLVNKQITLYRELQNKLSSNPQVTPSDIENLKAVILAIDWEISDTTLNQFNLELTRQMEFFKEYNIHHTFLQIINSTGRYVAAQKAKAHADSIFFLRSIFKSFESLILNPEMVLNEKRRLLESDLKKFQTFKAKITTRPKKSQAVLKPDNGPSVAPALSHLKKSGNTDNENEKAGTLTALDENEPAAAPVSDPITPALAGKQTEPDGSRDVMDDLFNIKESPADELLDAIHLLDVHGGGPEKALSMLDTAQEESSDGMKQFTPQRMDNEPIPEIGDRLDAFFNASGTKPDQKTDDQPENIAASSIQSAQNDTEEIVPFDINDEIDEPETMDGTPVIPPENDVETILDRLRIKFKDPALFAESQESIAQDLSELKGAWEQNGEKRTLVNIIEDACRLIDPIHLKDKDSQPDTEPAKKGFWQKLFSMFSS